MELSNKFAIMKIIVVLFYSFNMNAALADQKITLACRGELDSKVDNKISTFKKSIISIDLNQESNNIKISGEWGCPILAVPKGEDSQCYDFSAVFGINEIISHRSFSGEKVNGNYSFVINRNTGILLVNSFMIPNNNAKDYRWVTFSIDGKFDCEVSNKKF